MKQKKFKFSLGIKIVTILSCVALVSMGFASWWIVRINNDAGVSHGSFTVYEVTEKEVTVTVVSFTPEYIVYGTSTKEPATTPTWLIASDPQMASDTLTSTLTFTVDADDVNLNELVGTVNVTFVPNENSKSAFDAAIANGYISAPVVNASYKIGDAAAVDIYSDAEGTNKNFTYNNNSLTISLPAAALADNAVTVTMTFNFGWGAMTGGENPYDYFNTTTADEDYSNPNFTFSGTDGDKSNRAAALAMLEAVNGLSTAGYDVTINAAVRSAS